MLDQRRSEHRRQERDGRDAAAELLAEDRQLDGAQALAALLLRHGDAGPAELGQLLPQRIVDAASLRVLADALGRRARAEQLARGALDVTLVVGEAEVHGRLLT